MGADDENHRVLSGNFGGVKSKRRNKKFLFEFSIEGIEKNKVQQPSIGKKEFYKVKKKLVLKFNVTVRVA